jgi:CheY-like chemotaxis protein
MEYFYPHQETVHKTAPLNGSGLKVLIVEDEGIIALDISHLVAKLGHSVSGVVCSGEESVREAGKIHPDVVLMDIRLKGKIDGLKAARMIGARYHIPIIYITAFSDPGTLERALASKPLAFLQKPFDERELESFLSEISRAKSSP